MMIPRLVKLGLFGIAGYWLWARVFATKLHPPILGVRVTSGFGDRGGVFHGAVDYGAPVGTPVYAICDGVIVAAIPWLGSRENQKAGNMLTIKGIVGDETYQADYMHLSKMLVQQGQLVKAGDTIGLTGNTGNVRPVPTATNPDAGAHLHFALSVNGKLIDPREVFPETLTAP